MIIYTPYYNKGWHIGEIDTEKSMIRHCAGYPITIQYRGMLYNGDIVFDNESDARAWINDKHHMDGRVAL